jgi:myo-inositol-1(or 4)-monophosphatase
MIGPVEKRQDSKTPDPLANRPRTDMIGPMTDAELQDLLDLAKRLAADARRMALAQAPRPSFSRKADCSVVTELDHAIQAHILEAIGSACPDHAVLAEETVASPELHAEPGEARYCWVVDPLDGTRNYTAGLACFSTAIALLDWGEPIVAVVAEHNLDHSYTAIRGRGAMLNDEPIRADRPAAGRDFLIGIPSSRDKLTVNVLRHWIGTNGFVLRNLGSTALHLAMVAAGSLDAAFSKRSKIWDVAAGVLIAAEAGAHVTDPFGDDLVPLDVTADPGLDIPFLVGSPTLHGRLLETIKAAHPKS